MMKIIQRSFNDPLPGRAWLMVKGLRQRSDYNESFFAADAGGERVPLSWLLLKHFPKWLTALDKESLLTHFGAVEVVVMPTKGRMVCQESIALILQAIATVNSLSRSAKICYVDWLALQIIATTRLHALALSAS